MEKRQVTRSLVLSDRYGNRYLADFGVKGENVTDLKWKHITDRPFELNSEGKIPKEKLPDAAWGEISDRPFDLDGAGKIPKENIPAVGWAEIADRPFDLDGAGKVPKSKLPSVSWEEITGKPTFAAAVFSAGATPPADTNLLWIDTGGGGLKYWNGAAWATVPVGYT